MSVLLPHGPELPLAIMSPSVKKRAKCRKGNPNLKRMLVQAAHGAIKKKKSFYRNKYYKLRFRLASANKAKVAIANRVARGVYKVLAGDRYKELGYRRADDNKKVQSLISQLKLLGFKVHTEVHEMIITKPTTVTTAGVTIS